MIRQLKFFLQRLMAKTPFMIIHRGRTEIRKWLPVVTLDPLDLVLLAHVARGQMITVVQVGACDAVENDPVRFGIEKGGMRAILIEPNPFAFAGLQKTYAGVPNVTLVQAAIAEKDGEADFYRVRKTNATEGGANPNLQISSFSREHLLRHEMKPEDIERISVPCRSLSSLAAEYGLTQIDVLQIDAEGFDATVVRMALKLPARPVCINFEHRHIDPSERIPLFDLLKANDYLLTYDEFNILALQRPVLKEWKSRKA